MAITHIYLKIKGKENTNLDKKIVYWKERVEFIFTVLMALLLIYLFNPRKQRITIINGEIKTLLFLFGIILIITSNWNTFFHESIWFTKIQNILGKNE